MKKTLVTLLLLLLPTLLWAQEVRTWKSKAGKVVLEASWDAGDDPDAETVFLHREGKRYKYPFAKLSDDDQKFVRDGRAMKNRRGAEEADPDLELVEDEAPKPANSLLSLPQGKKFAVLVGVTDYATMNDLRYTVRDVEAIQEQLLKMGFDGADIHQLTSGSDVAHIPTKLNVERTIRSVLESAGAGDLVFLAFAGHGAQLEDRIFFCTQDTIDTEIPQTAVSISQVMTDLSGSKAQFKWMLVDACRNNPFRQRVAGVRSIQKISDPPKGIALFQSCAQDEFSYEEESVEHGVFTSHFVRGMEGEADADHDGVLTFLEVCKYTTDQTVRTAQTQFQASQRPYLSGNISDFVLMEDLNRPKAAAFFAEAQKLRREKKYALASARIDDALKLYPEDSEFQDEKGIIKEYLELAEKVRQGGTPSFSDDSSIPPGRQIRISTPEQLHEALDNPEDGTVLVLAEGTYNLSESYWIKGKKLSIYGNPSRPESVKIRFADGKRWHFWDGCQGSIQGVDVSVEYGIWIEDSGTRMTLQHCRLEGRSNYGCWIKNSAQAILKDCEIHDCGNDGIFCTDSGSLEAENCRITGCYDGICSSSDSRLQVTNCEISGNDSYGVWLYGGASGTFRNNRLSGNYGDDWRINDTAGPVTRTGNTPNE